MKRSLLLLFLCSFSIPIWAQQWQLLGGQPDGAGVTDIFFDEDTDILWTATGSFNWPNGEDGGIRKSEDDGNTWTNVFDAYVARFIMKGPDGNLYACVWDYPSNEGLYRSTDNGSTWDLLVSVPEGNNIFACAILEGNPNTIFAGTGQGIYRSLDNGGTWEYANTGLPAGLLIRSLAISPDGSTIAAGTVSGTYISSNDGDNWDKVEGDGQNEIVSSIMFYAEPTDDDGVPQILLMMGTESGKLFVAYSAAFFAVAYLCATIFSNSGVTRLMAFTNPTNFAPMFFASLYAATGGFMAYAIAGYILWQGMMNGLPPGMVISMFYGYISATAAVIVLYLAAFNNSISGCPIHKTTVDVTVGLEGQPFADQRMQLFQNIPNPFKDQTRINFHLKKAGETTLKLFDMAGNEVRTLVEGMIQQGRHSILVAEEGLRSGMYYYVLQSNGELQTKKLVVQ